MKLKKTGKTIGILAGIAIGTLIADILMCLISYGIIGWIF